MSWGVTLRTDHKSVTGARRRSRPGLAVTEGSSGEKGRGRGRTRAEDAADDEPPSASGFTPFNAVLRTPEGRASLPKRIHSMNIPHQAVSWRALLGRLARLSRLKVFDSAAARAKPLNYKDLLRPG